MMSKVEGAAKPIICDACGEYIEPGEEYLFYRDKENGGEWNIHDDEDCKLKMFMEIYGEELDKRYLPDDDDIYAQYCDRLCDEARGK